MNDIDIAPDGGRRLRLSSREVFDRGNFPIAVDGPSEVLVGEAVAVFDGFWSNQ